MRRSFDSFDEAEVKSKSAFSPFLLELKYQTKYFTFNSSDCNEKYSQDSVEKSPMEEIKLFFLVKLLKKICDPSHS